MKHILGIIGLGYVGLPLALNFAKHYETFGFDINETRIRDLNNNIDVTNEIEIEELASTKLKVTSNLSDIEKCNIYIIAVPTPTDKANVPDLGLIEKASNMVGSILKKGDIVIYESTVYPGVTEEICVPILESKSKLKYLEDFNVGYSPERINPGDKHNTLQNVTKIVSADTKDILNVVENLYSKIIKSGVFKAKSIKVAEAAKIIENTQRDVNIALMNELSGVFNALGIDTHDVLEAASSKYNFLQFYPGLVGGHCISVDPYYLSHKSQIHGYSANLILMARQINNNMFSFIGEQTIRKMLEANSLTSSSKILVLGVTFKENIPDIRNSKVFDLINSLKEHNLNVDCADIYAHKSEVKNEYKLELCENIEEYSYDCIILAVAHKEYINGSWELINKHLKKHLDYKKNCVVIDIKAVLPISHKPDNVILWRP